MLHELIACGYPVTAPEIRRGIDYLLHAMTPDGRWEDDQATFTVIPGSFYYQYLLMNDVIPLMALNAYLKALDQAEEGFSNLSLVQVAQLDQDLP